MSTRDPYVLGLDSCIILVGEGETQGSIEVREKVPFSFSKHGKRKGLSQAHQTISITVISLSLHDKKRPISAVFIRKTPLFY